MKAVLKEAGIRAALALLWLLHFLPLPVLAALAHALGRLLYRLAGSRRRVGLRNLALCFPAMPQAEREALLRAHFGWLTQSLLDRAVLCAPSSRAVAPPCGCARTSWAWTWPAPPSCCASLGLARRSTRRKATR